MTTERLNVLAGAAALREFTAPELAAFTGTNPGTVRQVLRREQSSRSLFTQSDGRGPSGDGRRPVLWRLSDEGAEVILEEIADEESSVRSLASAGVEHRDVTDLLDRTELYLSSAEDAVGRSYQINDSIERSALARIAINLANAANPYSRRNLQSSLSDPWWEAPEHAGSFTRRTEVGITSLQVVSGAHFGTQIYEDTSSALDPDYAQVRWRARCIVAFANLAVRLAEGLAIGSDDLMRAAEAVSQSSEVLPIQHTLNWVKVFIAASGESGNLPPVAILTKSEQSPRDLFPVNRNWRRLNPPPELAHTGYVLWVESWAEALLASNLIPGVVVSHDDTPESNEALSTVMNDNGKSAVTRAVIVASTADDFDRVYTQVFLNGGVPFPARNSVEGLLPIVQHALHRVFSGMPNINWPVLTTSADFKHQLAAVSGIAYSQDIIEAISSIRIHSSDLDLAERAMEAYKILSAYVRAADIRDSSKRDLDVVIDALDEAVSQVPDPQQAIASIEAAITANRRIIDLQSRPSYRVYRSALLHHPGPTRWRSEILDALASTYDTPNDSHV